jgi:hypothetical protein
MQSKEVSQSVASKSCPISWKTGALVGGIALLGYGVYKLNQRSGQSNEEQGG